MILIHDWTKCIYPPIKIGIIGLKTNTVKIHRFFCDKKRETESILCSSDILWCSLLEPMSISASESEH